MVYILAYEWSAFLSCRFIAGMVTSTTQARTQILVVYAEPEQRLQPQLQLGQRELEQQLQQRILRSPRRQHLPLQCIYER